VIDDDLARRLGGISSLRNRVAHGYASVDFERLWRETPAGHALAMKAIHGGKAKNDKSDSHTIASLLRGGLLPQAYVYPAGMRSTRDLLRRRLHLVRKRGELRAHIQNTRAQYNLPAFERRLAYPANRDGVSAHVADPSVRKRVDVDLALIDQYDALIVDLERTIVREAKRHDADAFHRLRSVPGIGNVLSLTILYEIHDITRFDRVQAFASYARLVTCKNESGGKKLGTRGATMGHVHVKWAFSEAAVLCLRHTTHGQTRLAGIEKKHGKGKARSILAHKIGRAVFDMLSRGTVFSMLVSSLANVANEPRAVCVHRRDGSICVLCRALNGRGSPHRQQVVVAHRPHVIDWQRQQRLGAP